MAWESSEPTAYAVAIAASAKAFTRAVKSYLVSRDEIERLVLPAYVAGGALLLAASALNPIGSTLILSSGLSSGFGAMAGLTLVPWIVERQTDGAETGTGFVSRSVRWIAMGIIVGVVFIAILGPGI